MVKEDGLLMNRFIENHDRITGHPVTRPSMKETTLCPTCKYAVQDTWLYCPHCGTKLTPIPKEIIKERTIC